MWLFHALPYVARAAAGVYYRLTRAGATVPADGPVLLVANHPNSLFDAALVAAVAGRPLRFLAKAPLFTDAQVGWLVRGAGAIPVYRAVDDPGAMGRNRDMFAAVWAALAEGAAVALFPEGTSHSEPRLAPLKTGAARIALGAAARHGVACAIVPVGLSFRQKERFRSEALVLVGEPLDWSDLHAEAPENAAAVQALTARLADALQQVTLNLERWEDAPLVETAEAVWAAEFGAERGAVPRLGRQRGTADALAGLRAAADPRLPALAHDLGRHARLLRALGLSPAELHQRPGWLAAARWALKRLALFALTLPPALLGTLLLWPPYRLTGVLEARARPAHDIRSTYKLLVGTALFLGWWLLLGLATGWAAGGWAAAAVLILLPPLGLLTLGVRERAQQARTDARRWLLLRRRPARIEELRRRQRELAVRLRDLWTGATVGR